MALNDITSLKQGAKAVFALLKDEGVCLNFKGYFDTISSLSNLDTAALDELFRCSRECLLWLNYFEELYGCTGVLIKHRNNKLSHLQAYITSRVNSTLNNRIAQCENEIKDLKKFYSLIECEIRKLKILQRQSYRLYSGGVRSLTHSCI